MDRKYIGIDNGVSGTVGVIEEDDSYWLYKTPVRLVQDFHKTKRNINRLNVEEFMNILKPFINGDYKIYIERPFINKVGFSATISSVRCHEATLVALDLMGLNYKFIDSKKWQKYFFGDLKKIKDLKKESLEVGMKLFPDISLKHNDRDGILIAQYIKENESKM